MRDIVGHDKQPAAYLVYIYLYSQAARAKWKPVPMSLRDLAEATGLSKSAVQTALDLLRRRKLIETTSDTRPRRPRTASCAPGEGRDAALRQSAFIMVKPRLSAGRA